MRTADVDLERCNRHLEEIEVEMKRAAALDSLRADDDGLDACCEALRYVMAERFGYRATKRITTICATPTWRR